MCAWTAQAASLAGDALRFSASFVTDWCSHHPHTRLEHVCDNKVDLIVREVAQTGILKDQISITVVVSPEHKLDNVTVDAKGKHSHNARETCMKKLEEMVKSIYHVN